MSEETALAVRDVAVKPVISLEGAAQVRNQIVGLMHQVLRENVDYGKIPGAGDKPALFKSGAEALCSYFGLAPKFVFTERIEQWDKPFFRYLVEAQLWRGEKFLGSAHGEINSYESKYRWRWVTLDKLPVDSNPNDYEKRGGKISEFKFAVEGKATQGQYGKPMSYWQQFQDAIDAGAAHLIKKSTRAGKEMEAWEIDSTLYRVPNIDIFDQVNTMVKMAEKRAFVAVTLYVTGASMLFTQDIEEMVYDEAMGQVIEGVIVEPQAEKPKKSMQVAQPVTKPSAIASATQATTPAVTPDTPLDWPSLNIGQAKNAVLEAFKAQGITSAADQTKWLADHKIQPLRWMTEEDCKLAWGLLMGKFKPVVQAQAPEEEAGEVETLEAFVAALKSVGLTLEAGLAILGLQESDELFDFKAALNAIIDAKGG